MQHLRELITRSSVSVRAISPSTSSTYGNSASATAFDRSRTSARTATLLRENSRTTSEPFRPAAPVIRIMRSSITKSCSLVLHRLHADRVCVRSDLLQDDRCQYRGRYLSTTLPFLNRRTSARSRLGIEGPTSSKARFPRPTTTGTIHKLYSSTSLFSRSVLSK